jgi:hypothetical protein
MTTQSHSPIEGERAVSEWQPIETAPKDGELVLLFVPAGIEMTQGDWPSSGWATQVTVGAFDPDRSYATHTMNGAGWVSQVGFDNGSRSTYGWDPWWCSTPVAPSHWMPIPPLPGPSVA